MNEFEQRLEILRNRMDGPAYIEFIDPRSIVVDGRVSVGWLQEMGKLMGEIPDGWWERDEDAVD